MIMKYIWFDSQPCSNQYGIAFVSHCVGSQYKGPCEDIHYPVPCADRTCKATYIDCLRAMSEMEWSLAAGMQGMDDLYCNNIWNLHCQFPMWLLYCDKVIIMMMKWLCTDLPRPQLKIQIIGMALACLEEVNMQRLLAKLFDMVSFQGLKLIMN